MAALKLESVKEIARNNIAAGVIAASIIKPEPSILQQLRLDIRAHWWKVGIALPGLWLIGYLWRWWAS